MRKTNQMTVYLTDAGRSIRSDVEQVWRTLEDETFVGFTVEERLLLRQFFLHMRDNLIQASGDKHQR